MSICCFRGCESKHTHEHHIKTGNRGNLRNPTAYITRICEPCRKALIDTPVQVLYFQCGGLAFVNELWEDSDASKVE